MYVCNASRVHCDIQLLQYKMEALGTVMEQTNWTIGFTCCPAIVTSRFKMLLIINSFVKVCKDDQISTSTTTVCSMSGR